MKIINLLKQFRGSYSLEVTNSPKFKITFSNTKKDNRNKIQNVMIQSTKHKTYIPNENKMKMNKMNFHHIRHEFAK